jgi:AmmeMemoRadiSam system protein B
MTRLLSEHAGILYPSDPHELERLVVPVAMEEDLPSPGALNGLPAALIVPHASYGYCLPQLRQAFSSTLGLDPELIVALAPLHRPCLLEDTASGASIFCPESAIWETPGGAIKLDEPGARALSTFLAGGLARRDCYFQEEYAIELILPFCLRRFPSVPLFPLLANLHDEAARLAARTAIQRLTVANPKTLFIISSNTPSDCGIEWIQAMEGNLERVKPYLYVSKEST